MSKQHKTCHWPCPYNRDSNILQLSSYLQSHHHDMNSLITIDECTLHPTFSAWYQLAQSRMVGAVAGWKKA